MFEKRLKFVLAAFGVALACIVVRLVDLQAVRAGEFRKQAEDALLFPPEELPFVRGRIVDRFGVELAADQASWDVVVDYGLLAMEPAYLHSRAEQLRRQTGLSAREATERLHAQIAAMWRELAWFRGVQPDELHAGARELCRKIEAVREAVAARRGFDAPIAEEHMRHAIITGLNDQEQVAARRIVQAYPWAEVRDSTHRVYHAAPSLSHILGRLVPVSGVALERDPDSDDPRACYLASELLGGSGVERAAERRLRGRRGVVRRSRAEGVVESVPPENGQDATLTIRMDLQETLYDLLGRELRALPESVGGSIVVLDVASREALALVSYPGYDNNAFRQDYTRMARDTTRQPLRFRAVANAYAPGSIVKPLACAAGLSSRQVTLSTRFECAGYLFPETRSGPRCWQIHGTSERMSHGSLTVADAIAHSCNIFMYKTGELVGSDGLCEFFHRAGLGRECGIGLIEEVWGTNPTSGWLANRGEGPTVGRARNLAIGQGEVTITPVQAANLMAVYASGAYRPVTLVRDLESTPERVMLPVEPEEWLAIRSGLFRVTNEPGATAYQHAHFVRDGWALAGKTGSATTRPWPISFRVPYVELEAGPERFAVVFANTKRQAIEQFRVEYPDALINADGVKENEWWPQPPSREGPQPAHAWFIGFLQAVDGEGRPRLDATPRIAFSVLVEFGGSGGRSAGPIAAKLSETLLDVLGAHLDPDAPPKGGRVAHRFSGGGTN